MKRLLGILLGVLVLLVGTTTVFALDFATANNITINDGRNYGCPNCNYGWWDAPANSDDNEVEPYDLKGQQWDLEGIFYDGSELALVGGYAFNNYNQEYKPGDIFIDTDGDMIYTQDLISETAEHTNITTTNRWGYDYVIHFTDSVGGYSVYGLSETSSLQTVSLRKNDVSGAWRYVGPAEGEIATGTATYGTVTGLGFQGYEGNNVHNTLTVDLGFLPTNTFTVHYTMQCGNDNIIGQTPEPGTLILLGGGLLSLCAILRKRIF